MTSWVAEVITRGGYFGLLLLVFLENVFPPIPSEIVMPMAGYVASRGELSVAGVVLAGTIGSMLGAIPWYYAGRRLGAARIRGLAERHGRWLLLSGEDVDKATAWFQRRGYWAVFLARLAPGVRTFVSAPAGIARMPLVPFFALTAAGSALWTAVLAGSGYWLGSKFGDVAHVLDPLAMIVLGGLALAYVYRVLKRRRGAA